MQTVINRLVSEQLLKTLTEFPAVTLLGPRQCGKTTLARSFGQQYFDLEQQSDILRLQATWDSVMASPKLVIFDEAQNWPELFNRLRGVIDGDRRRCGRFLLLGSVSPALMIQVSESLTGRLAFVELTPFLLPELAKPKHDQLWLCGGYPDSGILQQQPNHRWHSNYLNTLAQRELPAWGLPAKPETTSRLFKMLSAVHGQVWNASQIAQSLGLDYKTVNNYLEYLIGAFLIRRLQPFHANIKKRLIKAPKLYWRDSGLFHSLVNVSDLKTLFEQPFVGASWEGFAIEQIIGTLTAAGMLFNAYYLRTSDQKEIDLILEFGNELWAVEIKLTTSPSNNDMEQLNKAADLIGAKRRIMISRTQQVIAEDVVMSCSLEHFCGLAGKDSDNGQHQFF